MNNVNINDPIFMNTEVYKKFIKENPGKGTLVIRATSAGGAIPISNLGIVVSKEIDNYNVIFFEGVTDSSGMVRNLSLPAPAENINYLNIPKTTTYNIAATYKPNNTTKIYKVNVYNNIFVLQSINITPEIGERREDIYGG